MPPKRPDAAPKPDIRSSSPATASAGKGVETATSATFASTRQHAGGKQESTGTTERFANTKHNIALINDPKNGPRFTLTKKESGLVEKPETKSPLSATERTSRERPSDSPGTARTEKAATASVPPPMPSPTPAGPNTRDDQAGAGGASSGMQMRRPLGPSGVPPAGVPPEKVPVDSSKTFVGPNGTFYDESWRWMDWRGTKRSWNWPAALSFGHWFAYRRLYGHAALNLAWLMTLTAALVNNVHVAVVAGLLILTPVLLGYYANTLYFLAFRRAVAHVTEKGQGSYDELMSQLAKAGGVAPRAPWFLAALTIAGIGLTLAATYYGRGALQVNIWPL